MELGNIYSVLLSVVVMNECLSAWLCNAELGLFIVSIKLCLQKNHESKINVKYIKEEMKLK